MSLREAAVAAKRHWVLGAFMVASLYPLFAGLGGPHLWADEGDTAVLASSILRHGMPRAWDGVTFTDSDYGARVNGDLVMVSHPWAQYYAAAMSFALLGETAFAARFPFTVAGLLTLPVLYALVLRFADRRTAATAALLLTTSVQFHLFARQSRQYGLNMLFTCLLALAFVHLDKRRMRWGLAATAVVLFHVHPLPALATMAALAALVLWHPDFRASRRGFAQAAAAASVLTVPWFVLAQGSLKTNTDPLAELRWLVPRLAQFTIEYAAVAPVLGWIGLALVLLARRARRAHSMPAATSKRRHGGARVEPLLPVGARALVVVVGAIVIATAALACASLNAKTMWVVGTRHFCGLIPLGAAVSAVLVTAVARGNHVALSGLLAVMVSTNLGRITPWALAAPPTSVTDHPETVALHAPVDWKAALLKLQLPAFLRGLTRDDPGTIAHVARFLESHARPGEVVITNYEWEPLYFHTRLPQGLKIMPHYPVYPVARRHGLPEYVFSVAGARWIVWRWPWNTYREYEFTRIGRELEQRGAVLTLVASFPETVWENRPELGFHRFAHTGHLFRQETSVAGIAADVIRVDWPPAPRTAESTGVAATTARWADQRVTRRE